MLVMWVAPGQKHFSAIISLLHLAKIQYHDKKKKAQSFIRSRTQKRLVGSIKI